MTQEKYKGVKIERIPAYSKDRFDHLPDKDREITLSIESIRKRLLDDLDRVTVSEIPKVFEKKFNTLLGNISNQCLIIAIGLIDKNTLSLKFHAGIVETDSVYPKKHPLLNDLGSYTTTFLHKGYSIKLNTIPNSIDFITK